MSVLSYLLKKEVKVEEFQTCTAQLILSPEHRDTKVAPPSTDSPSPPSGLQDIGAANKLLELPTDRISKPDDCHLYLTKLWI